MNVLKAARLYRALKPDLEKLEGKPLSSLITNWKTTLAGIVGLFVVLGSSLGWLTPAQAQAIGAVAVSFGLMAAKDFNVSGGAKAIVFVLLAFAMCAPASAQTAVVPFQPQYYIGTGVTYDYYGPTGFAANTEFGVRVSGDMYSYSTLELTRTQATIRTGAAYAFLKQGRWLGMGLGDAGLATGSGITAGSFSGGGLIGYDIGDLLTKGSSHFYVGFGGRVISTGGQTVQPIFTLTLGKAF